MHAYCVDELRLSEDAAYKRIRAGRAARDFPMLFDAVARGDLSLAAVHLLASHLTEGNAADLMAAAAGKRRVEIEALLAARFPCSEFLAIGEVARLNQTLVQLAPGPVDAGNSLSANDPIPQSEVRDAHARIARLATDDPAVRPRVTPVSAERYLLHVPIDRATHDKLKHAVALLGHAIPSGDVAQVLDRALDTLVRTLERRKCARTARPARGGGPRPRRTPGSRHVPAHVRRAVWERDRGQCTFVGDTGHRCGASTRLEFDHVEPVARGGRATVETIRLRCRAHNQFEAERVFGAGFMQVKRAEARERAASARGARERAASERAAGARAASERAVRERAAATRAQAADTALASRRRDVCAALRGLGFRADEVRRGLVASECAPCATLQAQVSAALRRLGSRSCGQPQPVTRSAASPRPELRSERAARP
jgi:hypothetical protein